MFHDHDRILYISSLDQTVVVKEFEFMEEYEGPACSDFLRIYDLFVPCGMLYSNHSGIEVDGYVV